MFLRVVQVSPLFYGGFQLLPFRAVFTSVPPVTSGNAILEHDGSEQ
jgi:hypothetical protein